MSYDPKIVRPMKSDSRINAKESGEEYKDRILHEARLESGFGIETGKKHTQDKPQTTLPTDSTTRKEYPLFRGCLRYFPAALAGVAKISKQGNDKHNPGEEMHHARGKSPDHADCIIRHLMDTEDLITALSRAESVTPQEILNEASQMVWRALAFSQELHEKFGAPKAPAAK